MAKYPDYTPAAPLTGPELWACTQLGATFKVTATQVKTFVLGDFTSLGNTLVTAPNAAAARTALVVYSKAEVDALISAAGGYTDAAAVDAVAAALVEGAGIQITAGGSPNEIEIAVDQAALKPTEFFTVAASDETTAITAGAGKMTFRMPYGFVLTDIRSSLTEASSSGNVTIDVNEGGVSILSTKITVDAGEKTSTTAATPPVLSDTALADDAEMTIDFDGAGTGAKGVKVTFIGHRA
jgi:hypothetical protein